MKKRIFAMFTMLMLLGGCSYKVELPADHILFETKVNDEYMSIIWDDKEYIPYCPLSSSQIGNCLGYYMEDDNKIYVCELKGQSSEEWIVGTLNLDFCNEGMIYREINTTNILESLSSEYEWNN